MRAWIIAAALALAGPAAAEQVAVKYGPPALDLGPFTCTADDSWVHRVCYDAPKAYMVILLQTTWYQYCGIDSATVDGLLHAEDIGKAYNATVKRRFSCRVTPPPKY